MSESIMAPPRPVSPPQHVEPLPVPARRKSWSEQVLHTAPSIVVFTLLGGLMWTGHHTGWRLPKMSALLGGESAVADDWCSEHLVPESSCIECRLDLLPKPKPFGFCQEHGVAECVIHHPELAQLKGDVQLPKYDTAKAISVVSRPSNNSRNTLHVSRVQFASIESVTKAGIDVDVVQEHSMSDAIVANGELVFDPTRVAHLSTRAPGNVAVVFKTVGEQVRAGEVLAVVDATLVGQAKSQLLQAVVQLQLQKTNIERLRPLSNTGAVAQKTVLDAEAAFQEAQVALISAKQALQNLGFDLPEGVDTRSSQELAQDLRSLGVSESAVKAISLGKNSANLIPVRSPIDGILMESEVVAGEVVDTAKSLFTVVDPSRLWLMLNVRQEDAANVRPGLPVRFLSDNGGQEVNGQVDWVSPAVDQQTRTSQVRINVSNGSGKLRDKTFGTGRIVLREEPNAIVVPRESIQSTTDAHFVFVRDKNYFDESSPKFFHVRQVRLGAKDDQRVELLAGVLPGEVVATKGSAVLLAQLLRSNLGAGCGCHEEQ